MKICGIYSIKNLTNDKIYIGLSTNIEQRFSFHKKRLLSGKHKNKHFQSSFDKNGIDNFKFEVIETCEDSMLCDREKFWISYYKSFDREFGYNKTYGGEFGRVSDEVNERRREKLKLLTIPQEQRDRISKTLSGKKRPDKIKFDSVIELKVIEDFTTNKIGITNLAKKYEVSTCCIYNILKRNEIEWKMNKRSAASSEAHVTTQLGGMN